MCNVTSSSANSGRLLQVEQSRQEVRSEGKSGSENSDLQCECSPCLWSAWVDYLDFDSGTVKRDSSSDICRNCLVRQAGSGAAHHGTLHLSCNQQCLSDVFMRAAVIRRHCCALRLHTDLCCRFLEFRRLGPQICEAVFLPSCWPKSALFLCLSYS